MIAQGWLLVFDNVEDLQRLKDRWRGWPFEALTARVISSGRFARLIGLQLNLGLPPVQYTCELSLK